MGNDVIIISVMYGDIVLEVWYMCEDVGVNGDTQFEWNYQ